MKINMSQLRRIIRETLDEIATPGDDRYDYYGPGSAKGGHPGQGRAYKPTFLKGFDDNKPFKTRYIDFDGNSHDTRDEMEDANYRIKNPRSSQSMGSPRGAYVDGVGWTEERTYDADLPDEEQRSDAEIAADKDGGNRNPKEFLIVIDSMVTRGVEGIISAPKSGQRLDVRNQGPFAKLLSDLKNNFQKPSFINKNADESCRSILKVLVDHGIVTQSTDISEIGIRVPSNGIHYGIVDYYIAWKNRSFLPGFVSEGRKRSRRKTRR